MELFLLHVIMVSLQHDKGTDFYPEQGLLEQALLAPSKPAFPFAHDLILNSDANKKVFPNQFWHMAAGKHQPPSEPAPTHTAAPVHMQPLQEGFRPHIPLLRVQKGFLKEHLSLSLGVYNPTA